jgi:hypothetical protein
MGARPNRSIDTALDFLVQQIHATWQNKDSLAMLLLLDMTGACYKVVPARLPHNMRERKIPDWIVKWVSSFISNRTTTLCLPGYNIDTSLTQTGIPQGSLLSPIFFLFYNANLVNTCNIATAPVSSISFIDDVDALAFGKSTDNCRMLQSLRGHCLEWARKHGASFVPEKYILVHFTKAHTKHDTACPLTLPSSTIIPSTSAHVLGIIPDKKFSWQPHIKHITLKLTTQTNILTRLTASTWGTFPWVSRRLYTTVVCPALTTG